MSWLNTNFSALMTSGENHLRKEVGFCQPTKTKLNIGNFDWTIEFWYLPIRKTDNEGVVFEIGTGPRGENDDVTQLILNEDQSGFILNNARTDVRLEISSSAYDLSPSSGKWSHLAFVYDHNNRQLSHYVNGKLQIRPQKCSFKSLDEGEEDYMSIGRDGQWERPLPGAIDELRFSAGLVYTKDFSLPTSFSYLNQPEKVRTHLKTGRSLLFDNDATVLDLGDRKHLFIDDALIADKGEIKFVVNPPRFS